MRRFLIACLGGTMVLSQQALPPDLLSQLQALAQAPPPAPQQAQGALSGLVAGGQPQAQLPAPGGAYSIAPDGSVIPMALGLLHGAGGAPGGGGGRRGIGGGGGFTGGAGPVTGGLHQWVTTAVNQLGLPSKWVGPIERQAMVESSGNPRSPMHNTLVGLMQQDTGQYASMWRRFPGLRPKGVSNVQQAYYNPVYAVETALQYILGRLPGYGGYGSLGAFLHRGKTGY